MLQLYSPVHTVGINYSRNKTMATGCGDVTIYKQFQIIYYHTDLGNDQVK